MRTTIEIVAAAKRAFRFIQAMADEGLATPEGLKERDVIADALEWVDELRDGRNGNVAIESGRLRVERDPDDGWVSIYVDVGDSRRWWEEDE